LPRAIEQAVKFHQQGRPTDAERLYREVLRAAPRDFEALHLLGVLKFQQGQPAEALQLIGAALDVDANQAAAHSHYGLVLAALRRHEEALASYDRALAINPAHAEVLSNRGDTLCDLGRPDEAIASYDGALVFAPGLVSALVNRGLALRDMGRPAEALASYDRALAVDPDDAVALNNRGVALRDLDRHAEALASYERALALRPDYVDALFNRGNALLALKRPAEAIASYDKTLALDPHLADVDNNRGTALSQLGRIDEALAAFDRVLAIRPDHFDALVNRAGALEKLSRYDEAIADYQKVRAVQPDHLNALNDLVRCQAAVCQWSETSRLAGELTAAAVEGTSIVDPFLLLAFDSTPAQQLACAENWLRLNKIGSVKQDRNLLDFSGDKIRIAYLSADFHRHATAYLIAELFEIHDRKRFEIVGISFGPDDRSETRARLIKSFDRFYDVSTQTDADAAKLVRDLNVQIAVDLKGHTTNARPGILAQRPAPVQASYLGYPGTMGADFIDYVIADKIVLPFDQQPFYAEKIVHLPDSYQVNDSRRHVADRIPLRSEVGLPEDALVFCCFNNSWKINGAIFDIWMRLLRAVAGSVLWLYKINDFAAANLRKEAQARGVDPARIVFAPPVDLPDHLARLKLADLFLDTLPYNAHTTASDALWAGVPLVTCAGNSFAGRVAASLLRAVALPELVTSSLNDYEALARKLATEPAYLLSVRRKLEANRLTYPLFDTDRFRGHIEAAYTRMWEIRQSGEDPQSFSVEPNPEDARPRS
jgi:predicted O-linked N-acetylglucosamine transferase (SPINDLY family)